MSVPRETPPPVGLLLRKELLQAVRLGLKTQTRRLVGPKNTRVIHGDFARVNLGSARRIDAATLRAQIVSENNRTRLASLVPSYEKGGLFWVKSGRYGARAASRDTLRLTGFEVARIQDISEADAVEEGVGIFSTHGIKGQRYAGKGDVWLSAIVALRKRMRPIDRVSLDTREDIQMIEAGRATATARVAFGVLWDWIHGPGAWMRNDWVWVYEFEHLPGNVDKIA